MTETFEQSVARLQGMMTDISTKQARFRGCLYGNSGSGKTVLAQRIMQTIVPEGKGILYVDTSEGWVSIRNHPELMRRTQAIPFTTIEDIRVIASAIKNKVGIYQYIGGVILDEGSSMAQIDTDRVFEARKISSIGSRNPVESLVPEWPDYNAALQRFRQMNAELFDIDGLHVIIVAHVSDKKDKQGNIVNMFPSFSPKIAAKVKEPLHLVAYCTSEFKPDPSSDGVKYEREIQVHPTKMIDAKTRLPIKSLTINSDLLAGIVQDWLASGGIEVEHDDTPIDDPEPDPLIGVDPAEAMSIVDEATEGGLVEGPEIVADEGGDIFEPINI